MGALAVWSIELRLLRRKLLRSTRRRRELIRHRRLGQSLQYHHRPGHERRHVLQRTTGLCDQPERPRCRRHTLRRLRSDTFTRTGDHSAKPGTRTGLCERRCEPEQNVQIRTGNRTENSAARRRAHDRRKLHANAAETTTDSKTVRVSVLSQYQQCL